MSSSSSPPPAGQQEPFGEKVKRLLNNCFQSTLLGCNKAKEQSQIALLEQKIVSRQRQFGVEYINLVQKKASHDEMKTCLKNALTDINGIQTEINNHYDTMDEKEAETKTKIIPPTGGSQPASTEASQGPSINQQRKKPMIKTSSDAKVAIPSTTSSTNLET